MPQRGLPGLSFWTGWPTALSSPSRNVSIANVFRASPGTTELRTCSDWERFGYSPQAARVCDVPGSREGRGTGSSAEDISRRRSSGKLLSPSSQERHRSTLFPCPQLYNGRTLKRTETEVKFDPSHLLLYGALETALAHARRVLRARARAHPPGERARSVSPRPRVLAPPPRAAIRRALNIRGLWPRVTLLV